ncbi:hypothetical protein [Streptomyces gobiensis]|uniref:hypothetical protein n=1 Tax=Streptomyces gobiensis TaxID=2875706 RepID=UPI0030D3DD49
MSRDTHDTVTAVSPDDGLAYHHEPATRRLDIAGCAAEPVALAAARIARDTARGMLLRSGWTLLHASAVVRDDQTLLAFGSKGAGKTTTALALATRGWELLANDRVFIRPDSAGQLNVLPWPAAAAIGLGLLDALGWYDTARTRIKAGEQLHPTQHQRVTDALLAGRRTPLWDKNGSRELKSQVFPDQFAAWFGLTLATGGQASTLLFPQIHPGAAPVAVDDQRTLADTDFMTGSTEDRYPDIFGLLKVDGGGSSEARTHIAGALAKLPHHSVVLGHDIAANTDFLTRLLTS